MHLFSILEFSKKKIFYSSQRRKRVRTTPGSGFFISAGLSGREWYRGLPLAWGRGWGAWSLRVSLLAPTGFLETRTALAMALHPCSIKTDWHTEGCWWRRDEGLKGQIQKWFGRNGQRLTYQHTSCLCPENYKYSSSLPNKLVKSALEIFVIKLNVAGENILKKNFWFVVGSTSPSGGIKSHLTCPLKVTEILFE